MKPIVSIILPCYNGERYVAEAIESVLAQTEAAWELLVIDDGSRDNSREIISRYAEKDSRIRLLSHPNGENRGVSRSRKLGITCSKAEFIAHLDADDGFLPTKLERQIEVMRQFPDCMLCHSSVFVMDDESTVTAPPEGFFAQAHGKQELYQYSKQDVFLCSNQICNATVFYRRNVITGLDFDIPQLFQFEDWLQWVLLSERGQFYFLSEALSRYRLHDESATARVVSNRLVQIYSEAEFLFSLLSRATQKEILDIAAERLVMVMSSLVDAYAGNGSADGKRIISLTLFPVIKRQYVQTIKRVLFSNRLCRRIKVFFG